MAAALAFLPLDMRWRQRQRWPLPPPPPIASLLCQGSQKKHQRHWHHDTAHAHILCEVQSHSVNKKRGRQRKRRGSVVSLVPSGWAEKASPAYACDALFLLLSHSLTLSRSVTGRLQSLSQTSCQKYYALFVSVCTFIYIFVYMYSISF